MLTLEAIIIWALAALAGSFSGNFLSGYLKQKGENLATHEDIDKLVGQVRAVTITTKEIEAKISTELWDRQKQWELKREILLDLSKKTAAVENALRQLYAVFDTEERPGHEIQLAQQKLSAFENVTGLTDQFEQVSSLAELVCGQGPTRTFSDFGLFARDVVELIRKKDPKAWDRVINLVTKRQEVTSAVRKKISS